MLYGQSYFIFSAAWQARAVREDKVLPRTKKNQQMQKVILSSMSNRIVGNWIARNCTE